MEVSSIRAGIIGASGYTGRELIRLLLVHPKVELIFLSAKLDRDTPISDLFPEFSEKTDLVCRKFEGIEEIPKEVDLVFLALPHTVSMRYVPGLLSAGKRVIDLSADFRLVDSAVYKRWYLTKHTCSELLKEAVYGIPELFRDNIKDAKLVANPGCYPTCSILSIAPLLRDPSLRVDHVIFDAKSGVSGAGRTPSPRTHFPECSENIIPYNVLVHRHIPEIEQVLNGMCEKRPKITFVPHLIPLNIGMLVTGYVILKRKEEEEKIRRLYDDFYSNAPFIRMRKEGGFPEVKDVVHTNFCDIGLKLSQDKRTLVVISAIDNLLKGASGQAIQNMNIMFGWSEEEGIW